MCGLAILEELGCLFDLNEQPVPSHSVSSDLHASIQISHECFGIFLLLLPHLFTFYHLTIAFTSKPVELEDANFKLYVNIYNNLASAHLACS